MTVAITILFTVWVAIPVAVLFVTAWMRRAHG
jgi:hypothetical protein